VKIIRKDFIDTEKCYFCPQKLTTRIAYIIELDNGEEVQAGRVCAKNNFGNIPDVPNFTKAIIEYTSKKENTVNENIDSENISNKNIELEYLYLRCKLLNDFNGIKDSILFEFFNNGKVKLDDIEFKSIRTTMSELENSNFGYKNLMACYMTKRILLMLFDTKAKEFAQGVYEYLKKNFYITEKQIIGINNWINKIKNIPSVNAKWFLKDDKRK